jgi:hypothetical protein
MILHPAAQRRSADGFRRSLEIWQDKRGDFRPPISVKRDLGCDLECECDVGTSHLRNSNDGFGCNIARSRNICAMRRCALLSGINAILVKKSMRRIGAANRGLPDSGAQA